MKGRGYLEKSNLKLCRDIGIITSSYQGLDKSNAFAFRLLEDRDVQTAQKPPPLKGGGFKATKKIP